MRRTKPIWPGRRRVPEVKCAKRTQFPARRVGGGRRGVGRGANAQNEPNLPAGPGGTGRRGRGTSVECAKRSQFRLSARKWARAAWAAVPLRRAIVQNEPNSPAGDARNLDSRVRGNDRVHAWVENPPYTSDRPLSSVVRPPFTPFSPFALFTPAAGERLLQRCASRQERRARCLR
jgi:hypothetical protein